MVNNQRQEKLLRILSKNNSASVSELSKKLNSSMMTIRRDLERLEQNGIVKRYHGGAALAKDDGQPSFYKRFEQFSSEKHAIGKQAAAFIKKGDVVFFDAGTTPLAIVQYIPDDLEFTAVTTGLLTAAMLCGKPAVNVVNIGGNIHRSSYSSVSHIAVDLIRSLHADLAFISTKSIVLPDGTYEAQLPLIEIKKAVVQSSDRVILVADNSKFENRSMCRAISLESIDTVISDGKLNQKYISKMEQLGKQVIIAN